DEHDQRAGLPPRPVPGRPWLATVTAGVLAGIVLAGVVPAARVVLPATVVLPADGRPGAAASAVTRGGGSSFVAAVRSARRGCLGCPRRPGQRGAVGIGRVRGREHNRGGSGLARPIPARPARTARPTGREPL